MIKSVFILSALLVQSVFLSDHSVGEVFGSNATAEQTQNCAQDAENGDYRYEISSDLNNPTITFIPLNGNAGNPTCILYYTSGYFALYNQKQDLPCEYCLFYSHNY